MKLARQGYNEDWMGSKTYADWHAKRTSEPFLIIYEANEMDLKSPIADAARRAQSEALDNRRSWFSLIIWIVLRRW
jgi:hypothetical protein